MIKLGRTAQIYSDHNLNRAMKEILQNYAEYLSDNDKAAFNSFESVVKKQDEKIEAVVSGIKTAKVCSITSNRRNNLVVNVSPIFKMTTFHDENFNEHNRLDLDYATSFFNGLPIFVTEKDRSSDIHSSHLPKLLQEGHFDRGNYIVLEKHDLLTWLKNFDVGKVTNISKMIDDYKASLAAQRKAARAGYVPVEFAKRKVFRVGEDITLVSFEDIEKRAADENKTVIYSVVKPGWNEKYSFSMINKPTTKEEERNFKVSEIQYVCRPVANIMADLNMDKSGYLFVTIEAANYKALKLWNCKTWIAADDFVKTEIKSVLESFHKVSVRYIVGGMFDGITRKQAGEVLACVNAAVTDSQKSMPFYKALTKDLNDLASDTEYEDDEVYKLVRYNSAINRLFELLKIESPIVQSEIDGNNSLDAYPLAKFFSYRGWGRITLEDNAADIIDYLESVDRLNAFEEASKAE